jgi:hypothetical protein
MKKYIAVIIVFLSLLGILYITFLENIKLKEDLLLSKNNEKALILDNNSLSSRNIAYQLTVDQLQYFNDSIIDKLDSVRRELKIKDDNIKQMQYILSETSKKDTIIFTDTIFINDAVNIDTIIGDTWYTLNLGLYYPNKIIVNPTFTSEKYIITSYKKETINPPKKCKFLRMFQKKHKVIEVEVIENSPYINNKKQKFIEIIK